MSLLELKNIGKIYAQESTVSVGIRGVSLSFDRGEFVAITGKSGSGKSTLLNVISGMDTYEEGELFVEGKPTSHFVQADWEEYRKKYISFIFQDYNIIDSFTVLQNVELALMNIESRKERRAKAIELLERVGLKKQINQKGSRLSGGQKQRTVIARALAKDSPIILADEPTGNLDAQTSKEIIELLKEVSKDKLLIIVTHSFDEVEKYTTRHVRIFDGTVESDYRVSEPEDIGKPIEETKPFTKLGLISNGLSLGKAIFFSKPWLSFFMCFLLLVGTLAVYGLTALCGDAVYLLEKNYMFTPVEGRVILAKRDKSYITDGELDAISEKYGAKMTVRYDLPYDRADSYNLSVHKNQLSPDADLYYWSYSDLSDFGFVTEGTYRGIIGRLPEKDGEVFISAPISFTSNLKKDDFEPFPAIIGCGNNLIVKVTVTGYRTEYDGRKSAELLMNGNTLKIMNPAYFFGISGSLSAYYEAEIDGAVKQQTFSTVIVDFDMKDYDAEVIGDGTSVNGIAGGKLYIDASATFSGVTKKNLIVASDRFGTARETGAYICDDMFPLYVSADWIFSLFDELASDPDNGYKQASVFFPNDSKAEKAVSQINKEGGIISVTSKTEYQPGLLETIMQTVSAFFLAILWIIGIVFIAFFISLCSSRTLSAFNGDMAIMRSMGIPVRIIRLGMYFRMLISAIPGFVLTFIFSVLSRHIPILAENFSYVSPVQFLVICLGVILIIFRVTRKQVRKLFGESVKKSIRGSRT